MIVGRDEARRIAANIAKLPVSFPKIISARIGAMRQNHRMI
jgi:hypothetical protein